MLNFYFVHKFGGCTISSSPSDEYPVEQTQKLKKGSKQRMTSQQNKQQSKSKKSITKSKSKSVKSNKKKQENDDEIKIVQYRGIRSLFAIRAARRDALKGQKIPLLNIVYTTAFLQVFIVICITTIITLRKETEFFFLNTGQSFDGIFRLDHDGDISLLRTGNIINALHDKFSIFFNLTKDFSDHFIYPEDILIENTTSGNKHHHNLIPSAILQFEFKDEFMNTQTIEYQLNPSNYSILSSNTSKELISIIHNTHTIHSYFEIESYSFVNDVRNLWRWSIDYHFTMKQTSNRMLTEIDLSYQRIDTSVSWWNKDSTAFMGSVIASFGLCAFSIMALTRFAYKYGFCFLFDKNALKQIQFRIILPLSHLISLTCGLVYLINLSNIADFNDKWTLRLALAFCAWLAWCMLVFAIQTQGTEYGALFKTLKISFRPIMILIISLFPIAIGFILAGSLLFSVPNGEEKFTNPEMTAKTLYAVWLGDEVLDTFYAAGVGNIIAEIYMYTWGILFIAIIFNVGLAIVESNFFETIPQLEAPKDNSDSTNPHHNFNSNNSNNNSNYNSDNDTESKKDGSNDDEDSSESSDDDENIDNTEWELNEPETFKSDLYIFSNVENSFEYVPPKSSKHKESIRLNTVKSTKSGLKNRSNKKSKKFLYGDDHNSDGSMDLELDDEEKRQRNDKYIHLFISHLKHSVVSTISEGLIDKNVRKLLNKYPIDSQNELDTFQADIVRHYQHYLKNVKIEMSQFIANNNK